MSVSDRITETTAQRFCSHANCTVELKTTYIFPSDIMPEMGPRINRRSCSHYFSCSLHDKTACTFSVQKYSSPNRKLTVSE